MSVYLNVKGQTLAQEARIIRRLEKKRRQFAQIARYEKQVDEGLVARVDREWLRLYHHRVHNVRKPARATHIAYCFLRNIGATPFKAIEEKSWSPPDWPAIESMVIRYAEGDVRPVMQKFAEWRDAAGKWEQPPAKPARVRISRWIETPQGWRKPD